MRAIATILVIVGLFLACGDQKKDDSEEVAILAFLIASGALKPSRFNNPSQPGDPNGGDGLELAAGCMIDGICYETFLDCSKLGGVATQCR